MFFWSCLNSAATIGHPARNSRVVGSLNTGKLVFAQLMKHLPLTTFRHCVARYGREHKVKTFSYLDAVLLHGVRSAKLSRELARHEARLQPQPYHMVTRSVVTRNTLTNANSEHLRQNKFPTSSKALRKPNRSDTG